MFIKAFQVVLVTLLVIFTTGGAILLMIGLWTLLLPSNGSGSFSFRSSLGLIEIVAIIMLLIVAGVFLFSRRHHFK
jgi:hypothetical protein